MIESVKLGAGTLSRTEPHDEFLELCAVSTSGQLTGEEQKKLDEHLLVCASCREALREYQLVVDEAIPAIAAKQDISSELYPAWSEEQAERELFRRISREERFRATEFPSLHSQTFRNETSWPYVWLLCAAGVLLFLSVGIYAYRLQKHSQAQLALSPLAPVPNSSSLQEEISDLGHEREIAHSEIAQRDHQIADLRNQLSRQADEIANLRTAQQQLESSLRSSDADRQQLVQRQTELAQQLQTAQNNSQSLQSKLDSLSQQSAQDTARTKTLETRTAELTRQLQDRDATIDQQQQLLAHDRDIRDLMGARDLYIAEVYDVGRSGETKKPYGRVFYTRGKSLIFYAYDLDRQAEVKNATTFQAWGRRGPDRKQALNLGIFYEDNVSKKRWVLKYDNPKTLAQIDGVFVTVEPDGGSASPSGKSLLFASLRIDPNHP